MSDRQAFEAAIAAAPDDEAPRKIFADWLDENGFEDEATYQRRWTVEVRKAEEWFKQLASQHTHGYSRGGATVYVTASQLVEAGREWIRRGCFERVFTQEGDDTLQDFMFDESSRKEFWSNWELVTGETVPDGTAEDGYIFRCAC